MVYVLKISYIYLAYMERFTRHLKHNEKITIQKKIELYKQKLFVMDKKKLVGGMISIFTDFHRLAHIPAIMPLIKHAYNYVLKNKITVEFNEYLYKSNYNHVKMFYLYQVLENIYRYKVTEKLKGVLLGLLERVHGNSGILHSHSVSFEFFDFVANQYQNNKKLLKRNKKPQKYLILCHRINVLRYSVKMATTCLAKQLKCTDGDLTGIFELNGKINTMIDNKTFELMDATYSKVVKSVKNIMDYDIYINYYIIFDSYKVELNSHI